MTAHVISLVFDGRTWAVHVARTDLALPPPAPSDLPDDVRAALAAWLAHTPPAPTTSPDGLRDLLDSLPPDHHERPGLARAIEVLRLAAPDPRPDQDGQREQAAAVLMRRWGVRDDDQDGYDAACADWDALVKAGLTAPARDAAEDQR